MSCPLCGGSSVKSYYQTLFIKEISPLYQGKGQDFPFFPITFSLSGVGGGSWNGVGLFHGSTSCICSPAFFIFLFFLIINFLTFLLIFFYLLSLSLSYLSFSFPRQFFHKMHSFFNSVLVILVVEFLSLLFPWPDLSQDIFMFQFCTVCSDS